MSKKKAPNPYVRAIKAVVRLTSDEYRELKGKAMASKMDISKYIRAKVLSRKAVK